MAEGAFPSGDSATSNVVRCAECHELVPADRVRYREEDVDIASARGRWRAGGQPIFRPSARRTPGLRQGAQSLLPRNVHAIERVPICLDCLRRQRIGLYGVCGIAVACLAVAVALYSHEEAPPGTQQVAQLTGTPKLTSGATAAAPVRAPAGAPLAPRAGSDTSESHPMWQPLWDVATKLFASPSAPSAPAAPHEAPPPPTAMASVPAAAPPAKNDTRQSPPIWQPVRDAATKLFASSSAPPTPAPAPDTAPRPATPEPSVVASAPPTAALPTAPAVPPTPPSSEGVSTPSDNAPPASDLADSTQPAAAPPIDAADDAASPEPPVWTTVEERKPTRKAAKVAKASPATRRDAPVAANAVAMRNDGYTALQQRRYGEALTLLQQATVMGDRDAPMYIGQIFENGIGVTRDVGQASYWYGIAIDRGNGAALTAFNRMRVNPY